MIVEQLCTALNPTGDRLVLPFRFKDNRGTRTSHHLIFVTKHFLGYHIMKGVMARELAAWVSEEDVDSPIQATGGWLNSPAR